ncbi:MBL fold metallo-hydrolase [Acidobacteriota bacterium]
MRLRILGGFGGNLPSCYMTSFLLDDSIVIDAGSITYALELEEQIKIKHVVLSHGHFDHINGLPFFLDNIFGQNTDSIKIYSHRPTLDSLKKHLFNGETWPDFTQIVSNGVPLLAYEEISAHEPFRIENFRITPVEVNHLVPTLGYAIEEDGGAAFVYTADTGETDAIWELANKTPNLKAIIAETSYPNKMEELAKISRHLTPSLLGRELKKLENKVPILVCHIKPSYMPTIQQELTEIDGWDVAFLKQGKTYEF